MTKTDFSSFRESMHLFCR